MYLCNSFLFFVHNNNGVYMDKEYLKIVKSCEESEDKFINSLLAFISGGLIGFISEVLFVYFSNVLLFSKSASFSLVFIVWTTIASVLTGFGIFDKVVSVFKAGLIIPSTGFAHAMSSCAMDSNKEGLITGIGTSIFKLTGSIILYGIVSAIIFAFFKGVFLWLV